MVMVSRCPTGCQQQNQLSAYEEHKAALISKLFKNRDCLKSRQNHFLSKTAVLLVMNFCLLIVKIELISQISEKIRWLFHRRIP